MTNLTNWSKAPNNRSFKVYLYRIVLVPIITSILFLSYSHIQATFIHDDINEIEHFNDLYLKGVELETLTMDMQSSLKEYVNSNNEKALGLYSRAKYKLTKVKEHNLAFLKRTPELVNSFNLVNTSFDKWSHSIGQLITSNKEALPTLVDITTTQTRFEELKGNFKIYLDRIIQLKKARTSELKKLNRITSIVEISYSSLIVVFLIFFLITEVKKITSEYKELLEQYELSLQKAKESSRSKDLFLANMSHEIRTPLGAIMGFADLLEKESNISPKGQSHLTFIRRNAHHLHSLIDDIFDVSKIIANKIDIKLEKVDFRYLISDLEGTYFQKIEDKKIQLKVDIADNVPTHFISDETRIRQILSNLVGNAIKFSENGTLIKLLISSEQGRITIDVIDQGVGINQDQHQDIFKPFNQANDEHSRSFGGAGLGLSISKKLATMVNGELSLISSSPGEGSHFRFAFSPAEQSGQSFGDYKQVPPSDTPVESKKFKFKDKKILLAEDSKENRILFSYYLEETGCQLKMVNNGAKAINIVKSEPFDLVLMDIQMPQVDGYQALLELKNMGFTKPVMALTAHAMKGEREKCIKLGFTDYLSKPVSQKELLKKVSKLLGGQ